VLVALAALLLCALPATRSEATSKPDRTCGSYFENGNYGEPSGVTNKRVLIANRHVSCGAAITVVREFRSFLLKRHHGPSDGGWWTIPADPGWRCEEEDVTGSCRRGRATVDFRANALAHRSHCRNSITVGPIPQAILFLSWRHVGCALRHRIGPSLFGGNRDRRVRGFSCRNLNLRAGGGGALCRRGSRFVEIGFE
jgi:hypothetical protein